MIDVFYGDGHTVDTPNGYKTVHTDRDLLDIIEDGCGYDVADLVGNIFDELSQENVYEKERAHSDADALEVSCDSYHSIISEASEFVEQILKTMDEHPKMRKETLYRELVRLNELLVKNL